MWLFAREGFVSIVAHRAQPGHLLVRARKAEDLERLFPGVEVLVLDDADYRYRAVLPVERVAARMQALVSEIDYDDFRATVSEPERAAAYQSIRETLRDWGDREAQARSGTATREARGGLEDMKRGARRFGRSLADEFRKGWRGDDS